MRVTSTAQNSATRFRHAYGVHRSPADLVRRMAPLARAARDQGTPVVLALHPDTVDGLQRALGTSAGLQLMEHSYGAEAGSGQTVAIARARELRELTRAVGPVTVLTEHLSALDGPDGAYWTELDAAMNVVLAPLPVTLTCFFPDLPLHQSVLDGARLNHPFILDGDDPGRGSVRANPAHRPPREVLGRHTVPAPVLLGAPDRRVAFRTWQLQQVRQTVRQMALDAGFDAARVEDVVLAVNEVATNAVEHGGDVHGPGREAELCVWSGPGGLVCEVHDDGRLTDPLPGLNAPHPSEPRGRGLWIARQICDLLHVWTDTEGTHVRLRASP